MLGDEWRRSIFDFYSFEGAQALATGLQEFDHGRLVVHITEMPIKCPVAPLEFTFLAEAWLREKGLRDRVELVYVTPLPRAFTKPVTSKHLGSMLEERKILVESDFLVEHIDVERKALVSYDEREVPFDLLVTVPLNMGADFVERSGLGESSTTSPSTSTPCSPRRSPTSSPSVTPPISPPPRPGRWRTSRWRSSSTTSCSSSPVSR